MCTMSMVGDHAMEIWPARYPDWFPGNPAGPPAKTIVVQTPPAVSRDEFEALKREVEEMKKVLLAAKAYDERTGQPHCETDEKVELLKRVAELVGVDLSAVFGASEAPKVGNSEGAGR